MHHRFQFKRIRVDEDFDENSEEAPFNATILDAPGVGGYTESEKKKIDKERHRASFGLLGTNRKAYRSFFNGPMYMDGAIIQ